MVASVRLDLLSFFLKILSMSAVAWDLKILQACLRVSSEGMWQLELVSKLNLIYKTLCTGAGSGWQSSPFDACNACTHASTLATSLMRVQNSTRHFCLWHLWSGTLKEANETKSKNIRLNSWSFFFNLCEPYVSLNVVLPCMTSEQGENSKLGVNTAIVWHILNFPGYPS